MESSGIDKPKETKRLYEFGPFRLDTAERLLMRDNEVVSLTPKAYETLLTLVQSSGRVLEKETLMKCVWPDTFVEEGSLTQNISLVPRALGEGDQGQTYIETIPRRGYRFAARVREIGRVEAAEAPPAGPPEVSQPGRPWDARAPHLRRAGIAIASLALVAIGVFLYYRIASRFADDNAGELSSIVVLPFVNLTADPDSDYFSDGLTEDLISDLAKVQGLRVVAR